jgi:hypothetical protein
MCCFRYTEKNSSHTKHVSHPHAHPIHPSTGGQHAASSWFLRNLRRLPDWVTEAAPGLVLFVLLLAPYLTIPLIWDGRVYEMCTEAALKTGFAFKSMLCFGHPSFLYIRLFGVAEQLSPHSAVLMHLLTLAEGLVSIVAFAAVCRKLLPHGSRLTRVLTTLLYVTQPVILSNATTFTLDNGITHFFVILLALLLYGRHKWAAACGLLMIFTKETGVLFYFLAVTAHWLYLVRPSHAGMAGALRSSWKKLALLALPVALFALYRLEVKTLFDGRDAHSVVQILTSFNLTDPRFLAMMAEIFVFQFAWVQTAVILLAAALWLWKWDKGSLPHPNSQRRMVWFLVLVYAAGTYALTRYIPYNNLRYLMLAYPLGSLLFAVSCVALFRTRRLVNAALAVAVALQVVAVFSSVDPVSRAIFGTFDFGSWKMYPLGKIDNLSCCMRGRDQIVYNFQHLKLATMQSRIFERIRPTPQTVISTHPEVSVGFNDGADKDDFRWSWKPDAIYPRYWAPVDIVRMPDPWREVWFIEYPNFDNAEQLALLKRSYVQVSREDIRDRGYVIPLYRFVRR